MDLYKEVYEANTMLKFTVIVVDGGSPMRGATAAVELDIDNSCLIDVEYLAISYSITVNVSTGEIYHRVPGYYYYEYSTHHCWFIIFDHFKSRNIFTRYSGFINKQINPNGNFLKDHISNIIIMVALNSPGNHF